MSKGVKKVVFNKYSGGTTGPPTLKKSLRTQNRASFFRGFCEKITIGGVYV